MDNADDDQLRADVSEMLGQLGGLLEQSRPKDAKSKDVKIGVVDAKDKKTSSKPAVGKTAPKPAAPAKVAPVSAPITMKAALPVPVVPTKYNKAGPVMIALEKEDKEARTFGVETMVDAPIKPSISVAAAVKPSAVAAERKEKRFEPVSKPAQPAAFQPAPQSLLVPDFDGLAAAKMTGRLCAGEGTWYAQAPIVPTAPPAQPHVQDSSGKRKRESAIPERSAQVSFAILQRLQGIASKLLAAEEAAAAGKANKGDDEAWMRGVLSSGTSGDKLAALTLLVAAHPMGSGRQLDSLLALAGKKSRRESQAAMDALKDVFVNNLLPEDRRLVPFLSKARAVHVASLLRAGTEGKAVGSKGAGLSPAHLVFWAWEDSLATRYATFIECLASHAADGITHFKLHALAAASELLSSRPQGEADLLVLLAHKLGDKESKVASRAVHLLLKMAEAHPAMAPVLAREVQQVVLAPAAAASTRYAGVTFLNQLPLQRDSAQHALLASRLIDCYFALFETSVAAGELESRLLSALLTGVNRAMPYAPRDSDATEALTTRADAVFTVVHKGTFGTAVQALTLLQHVAQRKLEVMAAAGGHVATADGSAPDTFVDRFYRALYSKIDPLGLGATNKHALFLNLAYRSVKGDPHVPRARAVLKRLSSTALHMPAPFAAGVVLLVGEVLRAREDLRAAVLSPDGGAAAAAAAEERLLREGDADVSTGHDAQAVVRAMEAGADLDQVEGEEGEEEEGEEEEGEEKEDDEDGLNAAVAGALSGSKRDRALALLDAVMGQAAPPAPAPVRPSVAAMATPATVPIVEEAPRQPSCLPTPQSPAQILAVGVVGQGVHAQCTAYDPLKREPKHAGAELTCLWELVPLASHFHPSVRLFADAVLSHASTGTGVEYSGDPLADFTLMAFLDRLAYKNPKKKSVAAFGNAEEKARAGVTDLPPPGDELAEGYAALQGVDVDAARAVASGRLRGSSIMQKKGAKHGRADVAAPANSKSFTDSATSTIRVEEAFMHSYFKTRQVQESAHGSGKEKGVKKKAGKVVKEDDEDGGSDAGSETSAFAQELAEQLMHDADPDADLDEDMEDESDFDGEIDNDIEGPGAGVVSKGTVRRGKGLRGELDDDMEEDDDDDEVDFGGADEEEDEDGDEDEDDAPAEEVATAAGPARSSVFASADDFADVLASDGEDDEEEEEESGKTYGWSKRAAAGKGVKTSEDEDDDGDGADDDDDDRPDKRPRLSTRGRDGGRGSGAGRGRGSGHKQSRGRGRGGGRGGKGRGGGGRGRR